jgi:membrane protease YdiL (CAAX protease family)
MAHPAPEKILMSRFETSFSLKGLFSGEHLKPTLILLLTPLLLTTLKYYGTKEFYLNHLQSFVVVANPEWSAALYVFFSTVVLLGILPMFIIKYVFHEPLSSYGLQWGNVSFGLKAVLVIGIIFTISTYPSSKMADFLAEYPVYRGAGQSVSTFLLHALSYLCFYIGWEIYFRGFMQFGLRSSFGDWNAILIQVLASCLVHIGKPSGEIYTSILGGLIWGLLAFRTRSIAYGVATHWILGISLDFFIVWLH